MTEEKQDNNELTRYLGAERTTSGREHPSAKRLKRFAIITLVLMAISAIYVLHTDVSNYISSYKSLRGLNLDIIGLKIVDDDNPRALIRFRVTNRSPLEIELEGYWFDLYLGGETVGRSYSMYRGTDPKTNPGLYAKAQEIDQILDPGETLDLEFTLYIYPAKMEIVRQIRPAGFGTWHVRSSFTVFLPYSRKKSQARLRAEYEG